MKGAVIYNRDWAAELDLLGIANIMILIVFIVVVILPSHACVLIVLMAVLQAPSTFYTYKTNQQRLLSWAEICIVFALSYEVHHSVCLPADCPHEKPVCFSAHCDDECLNGWVCTPGEYKHPLPYQVLCWRTSCPGCLTCFPDPNHQTWPGAIQWVNLMQNQDWDTWF